MNKRAKDTLSDEKKAQVDSALQVAAKRLNCPVEDLEWSFGRGHPVQPIRIRKKPLVTKEKAHEITELLCGRKRANTLFPEAAKPLAPMFFGRVKQFMRFKKQKD